MADELTLTPEGRQKLIDELEYLEGEKNNEIIEAIKEARAQGDLSENSEYDAAREEQAKNTARIAEIRHILATAKVVEKGGAMTVSLGSVIEVQDSKGHREAYTIVGTTETDSSQNRISNESPFGKAATGKGKGDEFHFTTPNGKVRSFVITDIRR